MIATGDDIHAGRKNLLGRFGSDPGAAGRILTVGDDEIEAKFLAELGQKTFDRPASRPPYYVADEQNLHAERLI